MYFRLEDFIYQSMFLGNGTTPLSITVALQLFWMTSTSFRMLFQLLNKFINFPISSRLRTFQFLNVFNSFWRIDNFVHQPTL